MENKAPWRKVINGGVVTGRPNNRVDRIEFLECGHRLYFSDKKPKAKKRRCKDCRYEY